MKKKCYCEKTDSITCGECNQPGVAIGFNTKKPLAKEIHDLMDNSKTSSSQHRILRALLVQLEREVK
jgi:hypothetical protein